MTRGLYRIELAENFYPISPHGIELKVGMQGVVIDETMGSEDGIIEPEVRVQLDDIKDPNSGLPLSDFWVRASAVRQIESLQSAMNSLIGMG